MKLLVAALEKRKFAVHEQPRRRDEVSEGDEPAKEAPRRGEARQRRKPPTEAPRLLGEVSDDHEPLAEAPRQRWRIPAL
jgi:hypothetical protein